MPKKIVPIHLSLQMSQASDALHFAVKHIEEDFVQRESTEGVWKAILAVMLIRTVDKKTGDVTTEFEWEVLEKKPGLKSGRVFGQIRNDQMYLPMFDGMDVDLLTPAEQAHEAEARG